jgi:hypothetical protein
VKAIRDAGSYVFGYGCFMALRILENDPTSRLIGWAGGAKLWQG